MCISDRDPHISNNCITCGFITKLIICISSTLVTTIRKGEMKRVVITPYLYPKIVTFHSSNNYHCINLPVKH